MDHELRDSGIVLRGTVNASKVAASSTVLPVQNTYSGIAKALETHPIPVDAFRMFHSGQQRLP